MPKKGANISLSSYDDIFSTQESRQETGEHVIMLPLDAIHPFKNHPFRIVDDEEMQKLRKVSASTAFWFRQLSGPWRMVNMK